MPRTIRLVCAAILTWLGAIGVAVAQGEPYPRLVVRCGGTFDLCGFVDRYTNAEVIPFRFEGAFPFSEGLAGVGIDGHFGFIDETGTFVIEPRFDLVGGFRKGRAEVMVDSQAGVIDRQGNTLLEPQFSRAIPLNEDVVLARKADPRWRGTPSQLRNPLEEFVFYPGGFGLYSIRSGWLTKPEFDVRRFDRDGRAIWASTDGDHFGLLSADGKWLVEPRYTHVQSLIDERAIVCVPDLAAPRGKSLCGAVDPEGRLAVPLRSWWLGYWQDGVGLVRQNGKAGFIDKAGNIIGGRLFDDAKRVEGRTEAIGKVLLDGEWVGLDRQGRIVAAPDEDNVVSQCPSGMKVVRKSGKLQVVGAGGQPTTPYLFDDVHVTLDCGQPTSVRLDGRWGFIGTDGRLLIDPPIFDSQFVFVGGHAAVKFQSKWGIIDTTGRYTVTPRYDTLRPEKNALFKAAEEGREFWVDANGTEHPAPEEPRAPYLACDGETTIIMATVDDKTLWGIAYSSGEEIIKPRYRAIHCFDGGVAWVPDDAKRQWCPVGPDGRLRVSPACVHARLPYEITENTAERFSGDVYENSVLWTQAYLEYGAGLRDTPPHWISLMGGKSWPATPR